MKQDDELLKAWLIGLGYKASMPGYWWKNGHSFKENFLKEAYKKAMEEKKISDAQSLPINEIA